MRNRIISACILAVIISLSLGTILTPYTKYKDFFEVVNGVPVSHITKDEFEAANWLRSHIDVSKSPNTYIVSDHATSHIIRGMTGLNTTAGRHPNVGVEDWKSIQYAIKAMFSPTSGIKIHDVANSIKNATDASEVYIVLSKRTCWWSAQADAEAIRFMPIPVDYMWHLYCSPIDQKLQDASSVHITFRNNDVAIYAYDHDYVTKCYFRCISQCECEMNE